MTIVFAEMPEAAGRDLSIERQHLPSAARIDNFTYSGDPGIRIGVPSAVNPPSDASAGFTISGSISNS